MFSVGDIVTYTTAFLASTGQMNLNGQQGLVRKITKLGAHQLVHVDFNGDVYQVIAPNLCKVRERKRNSTLSDATKLYLSELANSKQIHGSRLCEIMAEIGVVGSLFDQDETILRDLLGFGKIKRIWWTPTDDQRSFFGLQRTGKHASFQQDENHDLALTSETEKYGVRLPRVHFVYVMETR